MVTVYWELLNNRICVWYRSCKNVAKTHLTGFEGDVEAERAQAPIGMGRQAWNAKIYSLNLLRWTPKESFLRLQIYCYNLEKKNLVTVTHIKISDGNKFEYFFMAIGSAVQAFQRCLHPIIIIDSAHLIGKYFCTMLLAIGMEGLIVNSDDEVVAFYSNNRVKKFFKKPSNEKSQVSDAKGSFDGKSISEEKKVKRKEIKCEDAKIEKKLKGDSGFDFHYSNGADRMANDCMLQKRDEKKNRVKDESYYVERLEEVRAKEKGMSLVASGMDEEEGTYQIWSSSFDDEEM
ncbi:unnamed protein product [Lactuca saligna]|uniref:Uncharacterized protein n=1 Tax=Lactuca saligna TaxID=75948 RepID=A0AA36EMC6_LACSI|nr:unnamed protein product [Lactuca saligna]